MIKHLAFERYLFRHLEQGGVDTTYIRARLRAHNPDRLERLRMLAGFAVQMCQDPYLGLSIGQAVTTTAYGLLGHACIHSETLLQAHRFMLKHLWVLQPDRSNAATLCVDDHWVTLEYRDPPAWPELPHFYLDLFFSANLKRSRELTDSPVPGAYLTRRRAPPPEPERYRTILQLPVHFGAQADRLMIPRQVAEAPLPAAVTSHSRIYVELCDELLATMKRSTTLGEQVRRVILENPRAGMVAVAQRLNQSERTLRRRLQARGTSFRALQQDVRLHLAERYLSDTTLAIADIAQLLGYFDTPTFTRAFRAWAGCTPKACRLASGSGARV